MKTCVICGKETRSVLPSDSGWVCWECHESGKAGKEKRKNNHHEDDIQEAFFKTVHQIFPKIPYRLLFAVPNGGKRDTKTVQTKSGSRTFSPEAIRLKKQGVKSGISDTILLMPRCGYNCLCMEFKTATGNQSPEQKEFQQQIVSEGGKYVIVRSAASAIEEMKEYLR